MALLEVTDVKSWINQLNEEIEDAKRLETEYEISAQNAANRSNRQLVTKLAKDILNQSAKQKMLTKCVKELSRLIPKDIVIDSYDIQILLSQIVPFQLFSDKHSKKNTTEIIIIDDMEQNLLAPICEKMKQIGMWGIYKTMTTKYLIEIERYDDIRYDSDFREIYNAEQGLLFMDAYINKYYDNEVGIDVKKLLWSYIFDLESMIYHKADNFKSNRHNYPVSLFEYEPYEKYCNPLDR